MTSTWITLLRKDGPAIRIHNQVYNELLPNTNPCLIYPSVVALIGRREKSSILRKLLGGPDANYPQEYHGQLHIWSAHKAFPAYPSLFADCELYSYSASHWRIPTGSSGPASYNKLAWASAGKQTSKDLAAYIVARVVAPLANVLCYFAADLNGIRGVAGMLADYVNASIQHDLIHAIPHVLVVVNTSSTTADPSTAETKLLTLVRKILQPEGLCSEEDVESRLHSCFISVRVLCLPKNSNIATRSAIFQRKVAQLNREARERRADHKVLFSY